MEIRSYINFCVFVLQSFCILSNDSVDHPHISDLRLCADPACSEPISTGYGKLRYNANYKHGVSFKNGSPLTIYSKSAGIKKDLWGIMVDGKRGYAPKSLISERKILIKHEDLKHTVKTELYMEEELESVKLIQDELPMKEDISVEKDLKEVLNVMSSRNILSSFVIPGSFAENIDSSAVKNEINPSKVDEIVVDGTTISLYDTESTDAPLDEKEKYDDGSSDPNQLDATSEPRETGKAEAKILGDLGNSQTALNSDKSENQPKVDESPGLDDSNNSDLFTSILSSVLESEHKNQIIPGKERETGVDEPVELKETLEKSESESTSDVDVNNRNVNDEGEDEYEENENIDDEAEDGDDDEDEENDEEEEGDEGEELDEKLADVGKIPDSVIISDNNITDNSAEQIKSESPVEEKPVKSDELTETNQEKQIDEISSQGEVSEEEGIQQSVGVEEKLHEQMVGEEITYTGNLSDSVIKSDKDIIVNETLLSDGVKIVQENANVMEQTNFESLEPIRDADSSVDVTNIKEGFDNVSAQSSDHLDISSKVESSGEEMDNFINRPEVKSEILSFPSFKETSKGIKNSEEPTSNKMSTDKISSDVAEFDKLAKTDSGFDHEYGIDNNTTTLSDVPDISKIGEGLDHIDKKTEQESDNFKLLDVKTSTEESRDLKSQVEESTITPPAVITETMYSPAGIMDSLMKKDPDDFVEGTTQSISDTLSLPAFSEVQPPAEDQNEIDVQTSDLLPAQYEEEDKKELPVKESGLFEEERIHFDNKQSADGVASESWFSFNFITDLFSSLPKFSEKEVDETVAGSLDSTDSPWTEKSESASGQEYCSADQQSENSCGQFKDVKDNNLSVENENENSWDVVKDLLYASQNVSLSTISLIYLIITTVAVIIFSLGYYYIENHRNDSALVTKINKLERELLVSKKEAAMFQHKFQSIESQVTLSHDRLTEFNEQIAALTQELEETRVAKLEIEEQYVILEKDLEAATESGLEMHRLLTESLSNQDGSQVLLKTVENLREKIDHQDGEIKELKQLLSEKTEEIDQLNEEMKNNVETRKALQEKLTSLRREKEEEVLELKDLNKTLSTQLGDLMEEKSLIEMKLSNDISKLRLLVEETQTKLADREGEIDSLKEAIAKLNKHKNEENLDALYDTAKVSGKLVTVEKERDSYKEKFLEEEGARKLLEDHVQMTRQEVKSLKENYEAAEKEKIEALTKLQVLSNYFKEKESQLQKELGLQESMWLQKQSDDHTIYEQMKTLREENEKYKLQNESLKKEICESESSFKIQIANAEQKAHDHWLTTRQLERRLKETQNETSQLRNRLTLVEKNATNLSSDDLKQNMSYSIGETNGDPSSPPPTMPLFPPTTSPPFMMFGGALPPPPTSEFIPHPPPPLGFPEGRPPPVGRISSPPLDHSFSPPPLPYFYDSAVYGGHHSPSPPPHRPMPKPLREMGMDPKDRASPPKHEQERTSRRSKR